MKKHGPADRFRVPRCWAGASALFVASGPSLTAAQIAAWRPHVDRVVVINNEYRLVPDADLLWCTDEDWYRDHRVGVLEFASRGGRVATLENYHLQDEIPGLWCVHNMGSEGFHPHPDGIMHGRNGGASALHVGAHMGVTLAVLLGYDCRLGPGGKTHHHGDHPPGLCNPDADCTANWARLFRKLAPELERRGMRVINASADTALDCFERADPMGPCAPAA